MTETITEAPPVAAVPFTIASRVADRFAYRETLNILNGGAQFRPVELATSGWVRDIELVFTASMTCASAGAVVSGDAPFNLVTSITLNDPTNKPIFTPISGYNLYLVNKYLRLGGISFNGNSQYDPTLDADYAFSATTTSGTAKFRLRLDLEMDSGTAYGCVPNVDANASFTLDVSVAQYSAAFSGTTVSAASIQMEVYQHYWMPTGKTMGNQPVNDMPPGAGDFIKTVVQTGAASASTENTAQIIGLGGIQQGIILVSRNNGVRTAFTAGSNVGLVYDNQDIQAGIPLDTYQDQLRRIYGYTGADRTTSYAPVTAGVVTGLDAGVLVWPFHRLTPSRDQWFRTRTGALQQLRFTPGSGATQFEAITRTAQVKNPDAFYRTR